MCFKQIALLSLLFIGSSYLSAEEFMTRSVTVSGKGKKVVMPDQVSLHFNFSHTDKRVVEAKYQVDQKSKKIVKVLKDLQIKPENIHGEGLHVSPKNEYDREQRKNIMVGYSVQRQFTVLVKDLSVYTKVMDALMEIGVHQIHHIEFGSSKREQFYNEAMKLALENAKTKAKLLSEQSGLKLGLAIDIIESESPIHRPMLRARSQAAFHEDASAPFFQPGSLTIEKSLQVTYEMKSESATPKPLQKLLE